MSNFKLKHKVTTNSVVLVNPNILRPEQHEFLFKNVIDALTLSYRTIDTRILLGQAPTGTGKSFALVHVSIPAFIQEFPHIKSVVFASPDSGCVDGPYIKFKELWHNKVINNRLGQQVRIRVLNKNDFNQDLKSESEFKSVEPVVEVLFATTHLLGGKWKDYEDAKNLTHNLLPPDLIIVDEIHYGMGTSCWQTLMEDQGRYPNMKYKPVWLTILINLAKHGTKIVGFTGTPTKSQQGKTSQGSFIFKPLPAMKKNKDATAFVDGWMSPDCNQVYSISKSMIEQDLTTLNILLGKITDDTWEKAKDINIDKKMPGALFKFGQENATNGLPLKNASGNNGHDSRFKTWARSLGADYGIATCHHKEYQKTGTTVYPNPFVKAAIDVINRSNNPTNFSVPVFLSVIRSGNMGWDITRLKYISVLTHPSGKEVTNMQQQLMARANRLPFTNMHSHSVKATEIASLDISTDQKKLLAEYVVFMCSTVVFISEQSTLLRKAFRDFKQDTYTSKEGAKLYMDAIDNYVPKNNVSKLKAPGYTMGYSAGSLNQTYKKHHCEACMAAGSVDTLTGKTLCEVSARKVSEYERGYSYSNTEWDNTWFHTLVLDHKGGDRTDYSPDNLITRCPTNNGVKTYDSKDYLGKYDDNGNKVSNG